MHQIWSPLITRVAAFSSLLCISQCASGSLVLDEVTATFFSFGNIVEDASTFVVQGGAGPEASLDADGGDFFDINIEAETISISSRGPSDTFGFFGSGARIVFESLDWVNDPTGVLVGAELESTSNLTGLSDSDLTVIDDHTLSVSISGIRWSNDPTSVAVIGLQTSHGVVPELSTISIWSVLGLVGAGGYRRR